MSTEEERLQQQLSLVNQQLGNTALPPQPATQQESPYLQSPLTQLRLASESAKELIFALVDEMAQDERWDILWENPMIRYLVYVKFKNGHDLFMNTRGESSIFIISPCAFEGQLVRFAESAVPSFILGRGQLAPLEVVEKARGVWGIPFVVSEGGNEFNVDLARRGDVRSPFTFTPRMVLSKEEVQMVERLADKGFLADRMFDTLITVYRTFKGFQEKELNIMTLASNMAEGLVIRTMLGQGGGKLKLSGRIIFGIVVAIGVLATVAVLLGSGAWKP